MDCTGLKFPNLPEYLSRFGSGKPADVFLEGIENIDHIQRCLDMSLAHGGTSRLK